MSSCVFSLVETSTYPAWLRPSGWLCHTSEQLTNCSQLSGVKELISEKWHFLTCFLKGQVCLLFFYAANDHCTLKWPLNLLFCLTSISTLAFFSDLPSPFEQWQRLLILSNTFQMTQKKRYHCISIKTIYSTTWKCFSIITFNWNWWLISTDRRKWLLHSTWKCIMNCLM